MVQLHACIWWAVTCLSCCEKGTAAAEAAVPEDGRGLPMRLRLRGGAESPCGFLRLAYGSTCEHNRK